MKPGGHENQIQQVVIPAGLKSILQPPDGMCKEIIKNHWHCFYEWRICSDQFYCWLENEVSALEIVMYIIWDLISQEVVNSLKNTGISMALDGPTDDAVAERSKPVL